MGTRRIHLLLACALTAGTAFSGAHNTVPVPSGDYTPPFQADGRREKVRVESFRMDTRPVTVGEYLEFVRSHPEWRKSKVKRLFADTSYLTSWTDDVKPPPGNIGNSVTWVSWYAAKEYCGSLGKRLPGTREWEYAARTIPPGTDSSAYADLVLEWYAKPSGSQSSGAGSINAFGLRDLFGRNWEWTSDFNTEGLSRAEDYGDREKSLFCGGGGGTTVAERLDYATYMRFAFRSSMKPEFSTASLGFRCAEDDK